MARYIHKGLQQLFAQQVICHRHSTSHGIIFNHGGIRDQTFSQGKGNLFLFGAWNLLSTIGGFLHQFYDGRHQFTDFHRIIHGRSRQNLLGCQLGSLIQLIQYDLLFLGKRGDLELCDLDGRHLNHGGV